MLSLKIKKIPRALACAIAACVFVVGMVIAAIFDFKISAFLTNFTEEPISITVPIFALVFEVIGEWPSVILGAFCCAIIMRACAKVKKPLGYVGVAGFAALAAALMFFGAKETVEDICGDFSAQRLMIAVPIAIVFALALFIAVLMLPEKKAERLLVPAIVCAAMLLLVMVGAQGLKILWGRVRMRELVMLGDASLFTPWYKLNPFSGYHSFPSGHTANAVSLALLPLFYNKKVYKRFPNAKKVTYIAVAVWSVFMALTRILVGAHYLSDVLCGALIAFIAVVLGDFFMQKIREA